MPFNEGKETEGQKDQITSPSSQLIEVGCEYSSSLSCPIPWSQCKTNVSQRKLKLRKEKINPVFVEVLQEKAKVCVICTPILWYLMSQNNHDVVIIIPILNLIPQD